MQLSVAMLAKKAIEAALKNEWENAIEYNTQILTVDQKNTDAKIRLGRAYIQAKQFDKAKKIFKEVLKNDPINQIALKNLDLATKHRSENKLVAQIDTKSLLKEPGTTAELNLEITAKGITANDFYPGEILHLKGKKKAIDIIKLKKDAKVVVAQIENEEMVQKINTLLDDGSKVDCVYVRGKEKLMTVLVKGTKPVFRAEKQDVRPYIKKGSLEEPELEIEESEPTPEE